MVTGVYLESLMIVSANYRNKDFGCQVKILKNN